MSESTREMLTAQLQGTREMLEDLRDAVWAGTDYEGQDAYEYLSELPLEIVWETGEPFVVVLGTGGPHIEITGGGRQGDYVLHGYWGSEHVTLTGKGIDWAGAYFREYDDQG